MQVEQPYPNTPPLGAEVTYWINDSTPAHAVVAHIVEEFYDQRAVVNLAFLMPTTGKWHNRVACDPVTTDGTHIYRAVRWSYPGEYEPEPSID